MAELTPSAQPQPVERTDYKPLSGLALAAIIVASLYTLIAGLLVVVGLISGKPVVIKGLLVLAIVGLALAIAGRIAIQRSEGTRAGLGMTQVAWWLSILGGAGYAAYFLGTEVAIKQQSVDWAEQWFEALKQDDFPTAFVMSLAPPVRQGVDPSQEAGIEARFGGNRGTYTKFRNSPVIQFFKRNQPEDIGVDYQGQRAWRVDPNGYTVVQSFEILSPEGVSNYSVELQALESEELGERQWQIKPNPSLLDNLKRTSYGRMIKELQNDANRFGGLFLMVIRQPNGPYRVFQLSRSPQEQEQRAATALLMPPLLTGLLTSLDAKDYEDRINSDTSDFFRDADGQAYQDKAKRALFREIWQAGRFIPTGSAGGPGAIPESNVTITPEQVEVRVPIDLITSEAPYATTTAVLVLVSRNPILLDQLQSAYAAGKENPRDADLRQSMLLKDVAFNWRLQAIESDLEGESPQPEMAP